MIVDDFNNKIYREHSVIYLVLSANNKRRKLGIIDFKKETFNVHRNYDRHLLKKNNSFGFNVSLLETAKIFNKVVLTTNKKEVFVIPVDFILKKGEYLFFKQQGFEKQIFLKLEDMKDFKL